jgi:large subunit ribosomal protein L9
MKVILQQDIPKVGHGGQIVDVKDGYARNFLIPRKYAVHAAGGALKEHAARQKLEAEKEGKQLNSAQAAGEKLSGAEVTILGKVGAGTKLYGSITAQDVVAAIQQATGIAVDRRRLAMVEPIKSLGRHTLQVRLHSEVVVPVVVDVTTEADLERRKAEASAAAAAEPVEPPAE